MIRAYLDGNSLVLEPTTEEDTEALEAIYQRLKPAGVSLRVTSNERSTSRGTTKVEMTIIDPEAL